jgi:hypothetical protein
MTCSDCDNGLHHCHDLLIRHADGTVECAGDGECLALIEVHTWVLSCGDVLPGECCREELVHAA